ncbi:MAG TPA: hypothetical protein VMT46_05430 [Anaerolineaceae bacterium]|nr:hypothetical protein [Anaerolineaceae bacterium]
MSPPKTATTVAEIYDQALIYARDQNLPAEAPRPHSTKDWPPENIALLERYREWLSSGGTSAFTTRLIYLTAAGHVLGFNLKHHSRIDLEDDFRPAEEYVRAKSQSQVWTRNNLNGLVKFKRFLRHERGMLEYKVTPFDITAHTQGLPEWLVLDLERFQHLRQPNWRPARLDDSIYRFWSSYLRIWRYLVEQCGVWELKDLKRTHLYAYVEQRTKLGRAVSGINADLRELPALKNELEK